MSLNILCDVYQMFQYRYFVQKVAVPYTFMKRFECLRVPEGDKRITGLIEKYNPIGWNTFISYQTKPTKEQEVFQIKMKFRGWDDQVEITDINDMK